MSQRDLETTARKRRRQPVLQPIGNWFPGEFYSACFSTAELEYGWVSNGVAMQKLWNASPKGRRPPAWGMYHCGSGHRICIIEAHEAEAFKIGDQVVALTDWNFDGLEGWKNTDPDLMKRFSALIGRLGKAIRTGGGGSSHEGAQAVAYARA